MKRIRASHLFIGAVALLAVLAAGTATASNMAFKINLQVPRPGPAGNQCTLCDIWVSLPYNNPLVGQRLRLLCDTDGNGSVTTADLVQFVSQQGTATDPSALDSVVTHNCSIAASPNPLYQQTRAVRLRAKTATAVNQVLSLIQVGSDIPSTQVLLRNSVTRGGVAGAGSCNGTLCDNQVDMVYHTTWTNLRNGCDSDGSGTVTAADRVAFVTQQGTAANPMAVDSAQTHNCALIASPNPAVQIGKALRIRMKTGTATTPVPDTMVSVPHF